MATFAETEASITLSEIEEIERLVDLKFSEEYKIHLLQFNGGRCSPNIFNFNENGRITESCVDWFLAIHNGKYDNLTNYIYTYKIDEKRLPKQIVPIAHDPGGNLICISCGKKDYSCIYFWDHENEVDYKKSNDNDYSNLYFIARSFFEFINELKEEI